MPKVNPAILEWARKTAGFSLEEAVKRLGIKKARGISAVDRLVALESGHNEPSRPMLIKMAKKYHRPLVTFYMSSPPRKGYRGEDFRTLPEGYSEYENILLDILIRNVKARQEIVRAIIEDEEDIAPLSFVGSRNISEGIKILLSSVHQILKITKEDYRAEESTKAAFNLLRERAEDAGIFVILIGDLGSYHTSIDVEIFRGFSLADDLAPFIIINDKDAYSAWSFTLIHELVHIFLGQTGISAVNVGNRVEKFCNDVAGEFFLLDSEINELHISDSTDFSESVKIISKFASDYNLSSAMASYKLYRKGAISYEYWDLLRQEYRRMWIQNKNKKRIQSRKINGGPSYYIIRKYRIGKALINFVGNMINAGMITSTKAGKVLGIKAKNVQPLIEATKYA